MNMETPEQLAKRLRVKGLEEYIASTTRLHRVLRWLPRVIWALHDRFDRIKRNRELDAMTDAQLLETAVKLIKQAKQRLGEDD